MKILHVTQGIDPKSGGPTRSVKGICRALSQTGVDVTLLVLSGRHPFENPCGVKVIYAEEKIEVIGPALLGVISDFDLVHIQGLWNPKLHKVVTTCRKAKVPYVISPRGMLDPWALSVKRWKKRLALFLYQRSDLKHAAAFHVTAEMEEKNVRAQGLKQPVIIAPNGVEIPEEMPPRTNDGRNRIAIFLSRLHPGKGLLALAESWARVKPQGWVMKVVGPDSYGHKAEVLAKLDSLGVRDQWQFVDMLDDKEKWVAYRGADLLIHPSVSENFGITIAEGLAAGLPVIATKGAPWQDLETYRCGWWIDLPSAKVEVKGQGLQWTALDSALREAFEHSNNPNNRTILPDMGERGQALINDRYTWSAVCDKMVRGYEKVVSNW